MSVEVPGTGGTTPPVRWGVIGPGRIADRFANAMAMVPGGAIDAVASRSIERAHAYGDRHGVPRRYGSYEDLLADPEVDVVYVATPHSRHEGDTLMCLEADKHVLCEKPFALNADQARRMQAAAAERGLFLMDGLWSRFLPAYRMLDDLIAAGRIGEPLLVEADFGFRREVDPQHRMFAPELGGGALLELGIYPLHLAHSVLGVPGEVTARGILGSTGVDETTVAVLGYGDDRLAVLKASLRTTMACTARISGTGGSVELPAFMHYPDSLTVTDDHGVERLDASFDGDGLRFEIEEVHRCIASGRIESPLLPLSETVEMMSVLDTIRARIGLVYPGE
ncbi:MAG: Gfo/Idh/MocA family oxidoreductase [Microthrixaceae bacterium]|nr:Gfo/Idh/MocA family oxidoreductase [Microthrixaceae bacterium]MCO5319291.1 Gfo/Idh/MocA family oxidoreductase [Microthrixaceae bacterium]